MTRSLIAACLLLTGCAAAVPVTCLLPEPPAALMKVPAALPPVPADLPRRP